MPKAHKVFRELRALTVRMGPLGRKESKAPQEMMVKMGLLARKGRKESKAPQDRTARTERKARREYKGLLAPKEMPLSIRISLRHNWQH